MTDRVNVRSRQVPSGHHCSLRRSIPCGATDGPPRMREPNGLNAAGEERRAGSREQAHQDEPAGTCPSIIHVAGQTMNDSWIAPSILSADFARLGEEVDAVLEAGADLIHFDVMDNHYVPNLTIGPLVCEALRRHGVSADIDVHLMVKPVDRIIPDFAGGGRDLHHVSSRGDRAHRPFAAARARPRMQVRAGAEPRNTGRRARPCARPARHGAPDVGEPGLRRAVVHPPTFWTSFGRCARASTRWASRSGWKIDGGVNTDNLRAIAAAGADTFVAGSAIFGAGDYAAVITRMREILAEVR